MATLVRFDPFRELASLQNEMGRIMGGVFGESGGSAPRNWIPALDVWETNDEIVYAFDLPGVPEEKIAVELENGALTVSAEREREQTGTQNGFRRYERRFGTFERTISLPAGVSEADVKAGYKDGVLELRVHKPQQPKPHRIPVAKGETSAIEGTGRKKED
jgi:HSP20 family protein